LSRIRYWPLIIVVDINITFNWKILIQIASLRFPNLFILLSLLFFAAPGNCFGGIVTPIVMNEFTSN
jgi:hypothetical protein